MRGRRRCGDGDLSALDGESGGIGFGGIHVGRGIFQVRRGACRSSWTPATGEVVASKRVRGEAGKSGLRIGINRGGVAKEAGAFGNFHQQLPVL